MADFTTQITGYYQAVQFRNPPAAELASYNAALSSGALTEADVQQGIENSSFTQNVVNVVIREYQAAFGRVPDRAGLNFWVDAMAANPGELANLGRTFANSNEFFLRYGATAATLPNEALVTSLYLNVFGRQPDAEGLAAWTKSGLTADKLLEAFAQSAEFKASTAAAIDAYHDDAIVDGVVTETGTLFQFGIGATGQTFTLTEKIDVGPAFTGAGLNDTFVATLTDTASTTTYNTGDALKGGPGTDKLEIIASSDTFEEAIVSTESIETIHIKNFSGTTLDLNGAGFKGVKEFVAEGADDIYIGSNSDGQEVQEAFEAVSFKNFSDNDDLDIEVADTVFAGSEDKLTVKLDNAGSINDDDYVDLYLENDNGDDVIEHLVVNSNSAASGDGNYLWWNDSTETKSITINGKADLLMQTSGDESLTSVDASGLAADLSWANSLSVEKNFTYTGAQGVDADLEIFDGSAAGDLALTVKTGLGDDDFTVNAGTKSTITIDAGAGDDFVRVRDNTGTVTTTVTAGAGDDVVVLGGVQKGDTLGGGDGADTLGLLNAGIISLASSADAKAGISGFERLRVTDVLATDFDISKVGAYNNLQIADDVSGLRTVSGFTSGANVTTRANADMTGTLVVGMTGATNAGTPNDTLNVNLRSDIDVATADPNVVYGVNLQVDGINVINVSAIDRLMADDGTADSQADDGYVVNLTQASNVTTVNVTGDRAVTINGLTNSATVDASAASGDFTLDLSGHVGTEGVVVKGSAGINTITGTSLADNITGGAKADTLNGGAGNDVINAGGGNDVVDGGAGSDTINGGAGNDQITGGAGDAAKDTLTGGDGKDVFTVSNTTVANADVITDLNLGTDLVAGQVDTLKLDVTTPVAFTLDKLTTAEQTDVSAAIDLSAAVAVALANTGLNTAFTFTFGTDAYLAYNGDANGTFNSGVDALVKVTGLTGTLDQNDLTLV